MTLPWYREAVIYCVDVESFQDTDGDGVGDLRGLIGRLDYLARLGVTCLWLNPIYPSPMRDGGYDVSDFYGVHPRIGNLGDFVELVDRAEARGMRILLDLVVNHTSDEHPWFQAARSDPTSPYRDWYVWSETEPPDRYQGMVFPGEQRETWSFDEVAKLWYYHRFYRFQPDLDSSHPAVRKEIEKIIAFWLRLGVAGFRVDAAPFIIELTQPGNPASPKDFGFLTEMRDVARYHRGDALLLAEANVPPDQLLGYFADAGGSNNRFGMLFAFDLNSRLMLALARQDAEPVVEAMRTTPALPDNAQWATFLRNHDEVDLSRLTAEQQRECFEAFAPKESMQLYGRGIRRRLAPMLQDQRRIRMAYSLQFTLPGTPVLRYGEEIGMGEDLTLEGRDAIRTPMQWTAGLNAGFSSGSRGELVRPVVTKGDYGYPKVNVAAEQTDHDSLLRWFERMIPALRECPEVGAGTSRPVDVALPRSVLAHCAESTNGSVLFLHNLADTDVTLDIGPFAGAGLEPVELLGDQRYEAPTPELAGLRLAGYGYRWIRVRHTLPG